MEILRASLWDARQTLANYYENFALAAATDKILIAGSTGAYTYLTYFRIKASANCIISLMNPSPTVYETKVLTANIDSIIVYGGVPFKLMSIGAILHLKHDQGVAVTFDVTLQYLRSNS